MAATGEHRRDGSRQGTRRRGVVDGGLLLFRVDEVPVVLAPSWWLGSLVITALYAPLVGELLPGAGAVTSWSLAAAFAILLGLSVLAHELGHCMVALRLGLPVRSVRLYLLGGLSEVARPPRRPAHEGVVAAAGPLVSLVLAGVCALLLLAVPGDGPIWLLVAECTIANLAVGVFNLLPGLPLDGGRMVRAAVWAVRGRRAGGTKVAVAGGGLVAVGLCIWALVGLASGTEDRWLRLGVCVLTGWFVALGASAELAAEQRRSWPDGLRLAELVRPVLQLPAESPVSDALAAAAGRGVVLVRADGVAAGLLDEIAAERLVRESPTSPAEFAADPIRAETVVLASEPGEDIAERVADAPSWQFLVVDDEGRPSGVLRRQDLHAAVRGEYRG